jgi:hypothetical protein
MTTAWQGGPGIVVIGIPTWCEADNIAAHTARVDKAVVTAAFPAETVIVNADNNSPDGTAAVFLAAPTRTEKAVLRTARGKGSNEEALFRFALERQAAVLITFDADLLTLPDDWLPALTWPILGRSADLTIPLLSRPWWDGTLTNQIVAPLMLAVTGNPIRQPIGGQYAFSPAAMRALLAEPWPPPALGYGWDVHMVIRAYELGLTLRQVPLSSPGRYHLPRSATPAQIEAEMATKFVEVATSTIEGLAALPSPSPGALRAFPSAPQATGEPGDYDLAAAESFADEYWRRQHSSPWLRWLLREVPAHLQDPPVLDDARWAGALSRAVEAARSGPIAGPLLDALLILYVRRQLHVLPYYRNCRPREVDIAVHALATRLRDNLTAGGNQAGGPDPL